MVPAASTPIRPRPRQGSLLLAGCLLLSACATASKSAVATAPVAAGPQEPSLADQAQTGLGLPGPDLSVRLKAVAAAPYAPPDPLDCPSLTRGIAELDLILGPDVDLKAPREDQGRQMQKAAGDAVLGLIPYRGVVRWISGAGAKERIRAHAVLAAAARRGFLKGLRMALACPAP